MNRIARYIFATAVGAAAAAVALAVHPQYGEAVRQDAVQWLGPQNDDAPRLEFSKEVRVDRYDGGFDHFLGPHVSIRTTASANYLSFNDPAIRVLIDAQGIVAHAEAVSGPKEFRAEAERKIRTARFIPFQRNGRPVPVIIERFTVPIRSPETRPDYRVPFPPIKDWASLKITMTYFDNRGGYSGSYSLAIDASGAILFDSDGLAAVAGQHRAHLSKQQLHALVDTFQRADWFWTPDYYYSGATHQPRALTAIEFDGRRKELEYSPGPYGDQPDAIRDVHAAILRLTNVDRWIKGNDATGPSLVAEGWNFKSNTYANLALLSGVAGRGTPRAFKDVLTLGAPVITDWTTSAEGQIVAPPILAAASRDDSEILDHLLALDVRWNQRALNLALFNSSRDGRLHAIELLQAGADPRYRQSDFGMTVLMAAASAGSLEIVAALLDAAAGSSPLWSLGLEPKPELSPQKAAAFTNMADREGRTALHHVAGGYTRVDASGDRRGVVRLLIRSGANIEARDKKGRTPLIESGAQPDVASELIAAGADVNAADNQGRTPLMESYYPWLTRLLLERGADVHARDKEGKTARDLTDDLGGMRNTRPVLDWWLAKQAQARP